MSRRIVVALSLGLLLAASRYAHASHLQTATDGAKLACRFQGTGIAIRLANNAVPTLRRSKSGTYRGARR
jgi:hypothetical protein